MIERLMGYREICAEIRELCDQIDQITSMAAHCTQGWGQPAVQGSGYAQSRVEAAAVRLADVRHELDVKVGLALRRREAVKAELAGVQDERHRRLLEMRYLAGWSVERIAEEVGASARWVQAAMTEAEKGIEKGATC